MERQRRIYSLEFKLKAVELSNKRGSLISGVARKKWTEKLRPFERG
jgi:transposase-like protein